MENFKFLKGAIKKHPTTGINLEYLVKQDAVCVALFDYDLKHIYLVKQYRPASDSKILEVVAGLIDEGENPITAAYRELEEETGFDKDQIYKFYQMDKAQYVSPGYTTEKLYYYAAILKKDAVMKEQKLDIGEDLEVVKMKIKQAFNEAVDTKTRFSIMYFKDIINENK